MLEKVAQDGPGSSQVDPRRRPGEECQGCNVGVCKGCARFERSRIEWESGLSQAVGIGM